MINFFRKTRKKMADDNNPMKYLRYAIGEILLVVIGILIALSINNWNEERKQVASEIKFISGVKNDLKQDKDYIESVIEFGHTKVNTYNILSQELPNLKDTNKKKLDSLHQIYFVGQRTFYPISGAYESAIAGNKINNFKNKKAIETIIKLYNSTYDRLIDNGKILDGRWEFISKKYSYIRRPGEFSEMTASEISEFLNDLYYHIVQQKWYIDSLNQALLEINAILEE